MDYNMLREVDWDTVKPGDRLVDVDCCEAVYVGGPDAGVNICIKYGSHMYLRYQGRFRLAPLTWLEGKPVYPGDMVYHKLYGNVLVDAGHPLDLSACSWEAPKVKRKGWINIYRDSDEDFPKVSRRVYETRQMADAVASRTELLGVHVACIEVEWEEQ